LLALLFALIATPNSHAREWTAQSGHTVTGDFISLQNDTVRISQPNGFTAEIPLAQLSEECQRFARAQASDNPFVFVPPEATPPSENQIQFTAEEQARIDAFLARHGRDVHAVVDDRGYTLLHLASGDIAVAKFLVSKGADVNAKSTRFPPLHFAAVSGNLEVVEFLVSKGADVNVKFSANTTLLHSAVSVSAPPGNIEVVKFLVSKGADVNAKDNHGNTPLDFAMQSTWRGTLPAERKMVVEYLRSVGARSTENNNNWVVHLPRIPSVDARPEQNIADANVPEPTEQQVQRPSDWRSWLFGEIQQREQAPTPQPIPPVTPPPANSFQLTAEEQARIGAFLAWYGSDVRGTDRNGRTLLHKAIRDIAIVRFLVSKGADVNATDERSGRVPLYYTSNVEVARFLVSQGADVNARRTGGGGTPLHGAANRGNLEVVQFLVSQGADVNAVMFGDWSPLDAAKANLGNLTHARSDDAMLARMAENAQATVRYLESVGARSERERLQQQAETRAAERERQRLAEAQAAAERERQRQAEAHAAAERERQRQAEAQAAAERERQRQMQLQQQNHPQWTNRTVPWSNWRRGSDRQSQAILRHEWGNDARVVQHRVASNGLYHIRFQFRSFGRWVDDEMFGYINPDGSIETISAAEMHGW